MVQGGAGRPITMGGVLGALATAMGGTSRLAEALETPERTVRNWADGTSVPNPIISHKIQELRNLYLDADGSRQIIVQVLRVWNIAEDPEAQHPWLNAFVSEARTPMEISAIPRTVWIDTSMGRLSPVLLRKETQQAPGGNLVASWMDCLLEEGKPGLIPRLRSLPGPADLAENPYLGRVLGGAIEFGAQQERARTVGELRQEYEDLLNVAIAHFLQERTTML